MLLFSVDLLAEKKLLDFWGGADVVGMEWNEWSKRVDGWGEMRWHGIDEGERVMGWNGRGEIYTL